MKALVPAYFLPGEEWVVLRSGLSAGDLVIMNPASGVGRRRSDDYGREVRATQAVGAVVLGYIATGWGRRSRFGVLWEAARYRFWYGVDGFFLDESAQSTDKVSYYRKLFRWLRWLGCGGPVALNPGCNVAEDYAAAADVLVVFEGTADQYASWVGDHWHRHADAAGIGHLVHGCQPSDESAALMARRVPDYGYRTDAVMPNPWDRLPGDWSASGGCGADGVGAEGVAVDAADARNLSRRS